MREKAYRLHGTLTVFIIANNLDGQRLWDGCLIYGSGEALVACIDKLLVIKKAFKIKVWPGEFFK